MPFALGSPLFCASLAGLVTYAILHFRPLRGDVVLLFEIIGSTVLFAIFSRDSSSVNHDIEMSPVLFTLVCTTIQLLTLGIATILWRISPWHPLSSFPGRWSYRISSLRLAGVVMSGWRHKTIQALHQQYGKVVRIGPDTLSINSRTAIGPIYAASRCMDRSSAYELHVLPGNGLFFTLDREIHHSRRNKWAPAFTRTNLEHFQPILDRRVVELTECMNSRSTENIVNLSQCIEDWSYDFMFQGNFMFGSSSTLELMRRGDPEGWVDNGKSATTVFEILGEVPWLMDILWYLPSTQSIRNLHKQARQMLSHRARKSEDDRDVCAHLGETLTEDEKTMDALFGIQAGSDTTANALQYAFLYIVHHRNVYDRLSQELINAFPYPKDPLDFQILGSLPYLNAVISEALRLGVPLSGLERITPPSGTTIDGIFIPGNTIVSVPAYTQELDPTNFFPDPEDFRPERWLPGGLGPGSILEPSALMSFSFGPYGCIGKSLAIQELRMVIARLLLCFNITFPPTFDFASYLRNIRNIRSTLFPSPLNVQIAPRE